MSDVWVVDLETSVKNRGDEAIGTFKASPFFPKNKIVLAGWLRPGHARAVVYTTHEVESGKFKFGGKFTLVGHNIKFDLLYLIKQFGPEILEIVDIWDTAVVEYTLTGQEEKFPSLDYCAPKYGGTVKPDKIKEYWDAGIDTEDIPRGELEDYLRGDLTNTSIVYQAQLEKVFALGMENLVANEMRALKFTTLMEWNGMYFNKDVHEKLFADVTFNLKLAATGLELKLEQAIAETVTDAPTISVVVAAPVSATSNSNISPFLFGGEFSTSVTDLVLDDDGVPVRYKSGIKVGQVKTKKYPVTFKYKGFFRPSDFSLQKTKMGNYPVGDEVLAKLSASVGPGCTAYDAVEAVRTFRTLQKDVSTYFEGYNKLVWPDGCIHPTVHHFSTATSRLSCSQPNLQNITGKDT